MTRYAAFLRGVMPTNAKMAEVKKAFEAAGFSDVKTVLGSGNVVFTARAASETALQQKIEAALLRRCGTAFLTFVRPVDELRKLLASDPYRAFRIDPTAKRVVTFLLKQPTAKPKLPIELDGARILAVKGREVFTVYVRNPKGQPVFMTLLQKTFGREQTTRTWETVQKVANPGLSPGVRKADSL